MSLHALLPRFAEELRVARRCVEMRTTKAEAAMTIPFEIETGNPLKDIHHD